MQVLKEGGLSVLRGVLVSCDAALAMQDDAVLHIVFQVISIHRSHHAELRIIREVLQGIVLLVGGV